MGTCAPVRLGEALPDLRMVRFGGESSLEGVFAPIEQHTRHPTAEVPA